MSALGSLIVKLALEYAEYTKALDKTEQETMARAKKMQDSFDALGEGVKGKLTAVAGAVAGMFAVGNITAAIDSTLTRMEELARASETLKVPTENMAGLRLAAEMTGVEFNDLVMGMGTLSTEAVEGNEAWEALGIKVKDSNGKFKDSESLLYEVADALSSAEGGTAKLHAAMKLLGEDDGVKLLPLLAMGSQGMKDMQAQARELGLTFSAETAAGAEELRGTMRLTHAALEGMTTTVITDSMPALQNAASALLKMASDSTTAGTSSAMLTGIIRGLATAFAGGVAVFDVTGRVLAGLGATTIPIVVAGFQQAGALIAGVAVAVQRVLAGDFKGAADIVGMTVDDIKAIGAKAMNEAAGAGAASLDDIADAGRRAQDALAQIWSDDTKSEVASVTAAMEAQAKALGALGDAKKKAEEEEKKRKAETEARKKTEAQASAQMIGAAEKETEAITGRVQAEREKLAVMWMSTEQQAEYEAQTLRTTAAEKDAYATALENAAVHAGPYQSAYLAAAAAAKKQAEALRELAGLTTQRADAEAWKRGSEEQAKASEKAAEDASKSWGDAAASIESSITDALMRGFESGSGFAENFVAVAKNMFSTLVLRPGIQAVIMPATGQAGAGVSGGALFGVNENFSAGMKEGARWAGEGGFDWARAGVAQMQSGATQGGAGLLLGGAGAYVSAAMLAYSIGREIQGDYKLSGVPDGIGSILHRAFGRTDKQTTEAGLSGEFSASGADVREYRDWKQKGGWFRSDKTGTDYSAVSSEVDEVLDARLAAMGAAVAGFAAALGLSADATNTYSQQIRIKLGEDEAANQAAIDAAVTAFSDGLVAAMGQGVAQFRQQGETLSQTLARLGSGTQAVDSAWRAAGADAAAAFASGLAGASQKADLVNKMGGVDAYVQAEAAAYAALYPERVRFGQQLQLMRSDLAALGLTLPDTKEQLTAMIEGLDLTTEAGREAYAALVRVAPQYVAITDALAALDAGDVSAVVSELDALSGSFGGLLSSVTSVRDSIAQAIAQISGASRVQTPAEIAAQLSGVIIPQVPGSSAVQSASGALAASVERVNTLQGAVPGLVSERESAADALAAAESSLSAGRDVLSGVVRLLADTQKSLAEGRAAQIKNPDPGWPALEQVLVQKINEMTAQVSELSAFVDKSSADRDAAQSELTAATAAVAAAEAALATARADAATASEFLLEVQSDYTAALTEYVASASVGVTQLTRLRDETLAYYEAQRALATGMHSSAAALRGTADAIMFAGLSPEQQLAKLQAEWVTLVASAGSATGSVLAGVGDDLNSIMQPLLNTAQQVFGTGEGYQSILQAVLGQSAAVADRLDALAPAGYEDASLALLGQIDGSLAQLEDAAAAQNALIVNAIRGGADTTAAGLRAIVAALTGQTVPAFENGGFHGGGVRLVGERGPELELTGAARYYSAADTRDILTGGRGGPGSPAQQSPADRERIGRLELIVSRLEQQNGELVGLLEEQQQMNRELLHAVRGMSRKLGEIEEPLRLAVAR